MSTHIARAIEQISDKAPVPEIDFTQHHLEDGTVISTQERVIKDVRSLISFPALPSVDANNELGTSPSDADPDPRAVFRKRRQGPLQARHWLPQESLLP